MARVAHRVLARIARYAVDTVGAVERAPVAAMGSALVTQAISVSCVTSAVTATTNSLQTIPESA